MLIGQASINLTANVLSALLGLASVFVFTRLFSPRDLWRLSAWRRLYLGRQRCAGELVS
jgi:hypothetical protein